MAVTYTSVSWERMSNAIEKVRQRLLRAARALEEARVPYAVAGGNAVAAWVSRVDEAAVRNTRDVDIVLRRADLPAAREALKSPDSSIGTLQELTGFLMGPTPRRVTQFTQC